MWSRKRGLRQCRGTLAFDEVYRFSFGACLYQHQLRHSSAITIFGVLRWNIFIMSFSTLEGPRGSDIVVYSLWEKANMQEVGTDSGWEHEPCNQIVRVQNWAPWLYLLVIWCAMLLRIFEPQFPQVEIIKQYLLAGIDIHIKIYHNICYVTISSRWLLLLKVWTLWLACK